MMQWLYRLIVPDRALTGWRVDVPFAEYHAALMEIAARNYGLGDIVK